MEDELRCYFVVNSEVKMGKGKTSGQVAHGATMVAYHEKGNPDFEKWYVNNQPKIVLKATQTELEAFLATGEWYPVHDLGRTQIEAGTLTCIVYKKPEYRSKMLPVVGHLQLL